MKRRKTTQKSASTTVKIDTGKEIRAIARERVGKVKASEVITPKKERKKPKHKKLVGEEGD
jgi:phage anti-repressor protein